MKISIVTPTFNSSKFIAETLKSILSQSYKDFEVLVVDDCSTDNTVEIVKSFNDKRIRIFVNDVNKGAAFSRNVALKNAKGEYIAFVDGDDLWEKDKLKKQISFMEENHISFSCTNYEEIDENGVLNGYCITAPKRIKHKDFLRIDYVGCLTVMYKKEVFPDLQIPFDIYKRNDYALWLKLSERVDCYLLNETLAYYRKNNGISSGSKIKLLKYHRILFQKLYGYNFLFSSILSIRNAFFYIVKSIKYRSKKD